MVLCVCLVLSANSFTLAVNSIDTNIKKEAATEEIKMSMKDKEKVLNYFSKALGSASFSAEKEIKIYDNCLKVFEKTNDETMRCTIVSAVSDGKLIDMKEAAKTIGSYSVYTEYASGDEIDASVIRNDFTWSISITYGYYLNHLDELGNGSGGYEFYRPTRVQGSWAPTAGNNVTMTNMSLNYFTIGWLTKSPDCLDSSLSYNELESKVLDTHYIHNIYTNAHNLSSNTTFGRTSALASNRAIWIPNDLFGYGVDITCEYWCNGVYYPNAVFAVDLH